MLSIQHLAVKWIEKSSARISIYCGRFIFSFPVILAIQEFTQHSIQGKKKSSSFNIKITQIKVLLVLSCPVLKFTKETGIVVYFSTPVNCRADNRNLVCNLTNKSISQSSWIGTNDSLPPYTSGSWLSSMSPSRVDLSFLFSTKIICKKIQSQGED